VSTQIDWCVEDLPDDGLSAVAAAAAALKAAQAKIEDLKQQLKAAVAAELKIACEELPAAMSALGMQEFTLTTGEKITVKEEVHCDITGPKEEAAFAWLRAHEFDSIIKRQLVAAFGAGDDALANETYELLREKLPEDTELVSKQFVHAQTLKAFVKERLNAERAGGVAAEAQLPQDLFGVWVINRAALKAAKK